MRRVRIIEPLLTLPDGVPRAAPSGYPKISIFIILSNAISDVLCILIFSHNTVQRVADDRSAEQKYTVRILAYFATNVRKKREAESGVYLTPHASKSLHFLGFLWWIRAFSMGYGESK
jgi:hypothetical protein